MRTLHTLQEADQDGIITLRIPVEQAQARYRLVIQIEPETPLPPKTPEELGWPPGFIEQTAGAWQGEFVLDSEGDYEKREDL
jgi:hypothetical protein